MAVSVAATEIVAVVPAATSISGLGIGISKFPGRLTVLTTSEAACSFSATSSLNLSRSVRSKSIKPEYTSKEGCTASTTSSTIFSATDFSGSGSSTILFTAKGCCCFLFFLKSTSHARSQGGFGGSVEPPFKWPEVNYLATPHI